MLEQYLNQDIEHPIYLFHGSPKFLREIHPSQSYDSTGNNQNIAIRASVNPNTNLAVIPSYYLTCKFKITPSISTGPLKVNLLNGLGNGFSMDASKMNKWFGAIAVFEKSSVAEGGNINPNLIVLYKQEASTNKIYLIDVRRDTFA